MDRNGFTIVELIVIIAVMGILMILGVANLSDSQANGRDSERKTDIETIAVQLESFYKSGEDISTTLGRYPSTAIFNGGTNSIKRMLRDIDVKSITAPGISNPTSTFIAANVISTVAVNISSITGPITKDQYIYQPLKNDNDLCTIETEDCRKFNLYYKLEIATPECPAPNNICKLTSKNQ